VFGVSVKEYYGVGKETEETEKGVEFYGGIFKEDFLHMPFFILPPPYFPHHFLFTP